MNRYGSVIFDYRGGRLVLGAGSAPASHAAEPRGNR